MNSYKKSFKTRNTNALKGTRAQGRRRRINGNRRYINRAGQRGSIVGIVPRRSVRSAPFDVYRNPSMLRDQYNRSLMQYYRALLDPEYCCINNLEVKLPNPIPLPTKTLNVKNTYTFTLNSYGNLLLSWRPGFLMTQNFIDDMHKFVIDKYKEMSLSNFSVDKDTALVGNITYNNSSALNGEENNENNFFRSSKVSQLPTNKYRLVSAKMALTYNGKTLDESGTIISGQYIGGLRPAWAIGHNVIDNTHSLNPDIALKICDRSNEMSNFAKFDNILNLPYGQRNPVQKGVRYSFYYYPMDELTQIFSQNGSFSIGDDQPSFVTDNSSTARSGMLYSRYQDGIENLLSAARDLDFTQNNSVSVPQTIPNYIVALQNCPAGTSSIEVNTYENYEVVMGVDGNMIASSVQLPQVSKEQLKNMRQKVLDQVSRNPRLSVSESMVQNVLKHSA